MTEPVRKPVAVLDGLKAALKAHPDQRVMQVIVNAISNGDLFYIDDEDAAMALYGYAKSVD